MWYSVLIIYLPLLFLFVSRSKRDDATQLKESRTATNLPVVRIALTESTHTMRTGIKKRAAVKPLSAVADQPNLPVM
jgi:hypothetical protein